VVNAPRAVRDTPEKLVPLELPDLTPPTLVTADPERIRGFRALHGDLVLKPLFDKAGAGIFFVDRDDPNFDVLVESWVPAQHTPVIVQRYQPEAREGSVRVLVVDGVPCAALRGVPHPARRRGNLDRSARVEAANLTDEQTACVARVAELLTRRGIVLAGVDLVGPWLLEVNVTSPGGVVYHDRVYGEPLSPRIWDAMERASATRAL
jgi:glutathione synthase